MDGDQVTIAMPCHVCPRTGFFTMNNKASLPKAAPFSHFTCVPGCPAAAGAKRRRAAGACARALRLQHDGVQRMPSNLPAFYYEPTLLL